MIRRTAHNPRYVKSLGRVADSSASRSTLKFAIAAALSCGVVLGGALLPATAVHADAPSAVTGLKRGSTGDAVRQVQQALLDRGIAVAGGADGVFGPGTETALKQFQTSQGLSATGTVTAATALALGLASSPFLGLTTGARGDAVRQLQQNLLDRGIAVAGGADGIYGPGTTAAVKEFQRQLGFSPSGSVNAATAAALGEASPSQPANPAPPANPPANSLAGLKVGDRGDAVRQVQQLLLDAGVTVVGGADGVFGAQTRAALASFQSAKGLQASGSVDQATLDALQSSQGGGGGQHGVSNGGGGGGQSSSMVGVGLGSTGEGVKLVQQALVSAGYTVDGGADGVFGPATERAVKSFQGSNGIARTGKVDERTAQALMTILGKAAPGTSNAGYVGLQAGAAGAGVQTLQKRLLELGIEVRGGADGIFGPATAQAVKSFQTSQGLEATGKVDQATADKLANPTPVTQPPASSDGYAEYGETGQRVLTLQAALVKAGVPLRGGVDGSFGSGTAAAVMEFQRLKGLPMTGKVDGATAAALGIGAAPAPVQTPTTQVTLDVFPTAKPCGFADTWHYTRGGGRQHLGTDIIAPAGTPVYAAFTGKISQVYIDAPGSLSGNGLKVKRADGTYVFYAHLTEFAPGIELGVPVQAGQLIGTVGSTGNAATPHLHFEIHPGGGAAINPYSTLKAMKFC